MQKITKLCMSAVLTTSIISGYAQVKGIEKVQAKEIEKTQREDMKKVEVQKKVGKYTMPDEKANMKEHGYNGLMNLHTGQNISKK